MSADEHHVTLVSTASSDLYGDNTAAHFKNKLQNPLNLEDGNWEVALLDIQVPEFVLQIPERINVLQIKTTKSVTNASTIQHDRVTDYYSNLKRFESYFTAADVLKIREMWREEDDENSRVTMETNLNALKAAAERSKTEASATLTTTQRSTPIDIERYDRAARIVRAANDEIDEIQRKLEAMSEMVFKKWTLVLPAGVYTTVHAIIEYINLAVIMLMFTVGWCFMRYDYVIGCVCFYNHPKFDSLTFYNNEITKRLGIFRNTDNNSEMFVAFPTADDDTDACKSLTCVFAKDVPDVRNGQSTYFVYSDCVPVCNIGDSTGQLLRQINIPTNNGAMFVTNGIAIFTKPYYKAVTRTFIDSLEIDIRNMSGMRPLFMRGCTTCTLHFRKRL